MTKDEAYEAIRTWLLDNYEAVLETIAPLVKQRDTLLIEQPHLTGDIKDQFKWFACSYIIKMISDARADIPAEDVQVYIRSMDLNYFMTLDIHA